jgi:PKD repeat protein
MRRLLLIPAAIVFLSAAMGTSVASADPVVMAAGDIACAAAGISTPGTCSQAYTANLLTTQRNSAEGLAAVLTLGDNQYENGGLSDYRKYFGATWGQVSGILHPALGNHEYQTSGAAGYFDYFSELGVATGNRGEGWYSFDIGRWHLVALNSSNACKPVSCAKGSPQELWLNHDLASTQQPCILAYWHHPLSSVSAERDMWQDLYDAGADLVLVGHVHTYEKPVAHDASGRADPNGPREVVVGTGGKSGGIYGVLKLTLHDGSFDWRFVGSGTSDSGSAACHGPVPPSTKPTASFTATTSGLTASFADTSTGSPTSWTWDFGDGATTSAQNPSHTYAQTGTYTVRLSATNAGGTDTATQPVTVSGGQPPASGATLVAPQPASTASSAASAPKDTTPPNVALISAAKNLKTALSKGLRLVLTTSEGGTATVTLKVDRATARKLELNLKAKGPVKVGSSQTTLVPGRSTATVKLTAKARKAIKKVHKVELLVTVLITDAVGNSATRAMTVTLER